MTRITTTFALDSTRKKSVFWWKVNPREIATDSTLSHLLLSVFRSLTFYHDTFDSFKTRTFERDAMLPQNNGNNSYTRVPSSKRLKSGYKTCHVTKNATNEKISVGLCFKENKIEDTIERKRREIISNLITMH